MENNMARDEHDAELWTEEYQKALEDLADQEFTPQKPVSEYEMGYEAGLRDAMNRRNGREEPYPGQDPYGNIPYGGVREEYDAHRINRDEYSEYGDGYEEEFPEDDLENSGRRVRKDSRRYGGRYSENKAEAKARRSEERERERENERQLKKERKKKKKNTFPIIVSIIILIILLPLLWLWKQLQGVHIGDFNIEELSQHISEQVLNSSETGAMAGYRNIALFGVDSTEGTLDAGNNRSDVMVIASVNNKTGDIKLVSLYRDTYLDIGDGNYQKANAAYAYGGPEQAVRMLNTNLDLNITDYATVGFEGIARVIDAVGGIEIDVQEDEIEHLNNYQLTMSQETGLANIPVTQAGLQTLNGLQATAYCRIRYTTGNDFRRTERQREVLTKTFQKIKKNPVGIIRNMDSIMEHVRTSLSVTEILAMAPQAIQFNVAENSGIPVEELRTVGYIGDQSCIIPITLAANVTWLHEYLFNDTGYTPSDTVQGISEHIRAVSGY